MGNQIDYAARPRTAAIVLAAGRDAESRALLTRKLGDTTVIGAAVANVAKVVPAERIIIVTAAGDNTVREALGDGPYQFVEQAEPRGTGDAVLAAATAVENLGAASGNVSRVLVTYGDTPLLRPETLSGLLARFSLKHADLALLTAIVDNSEGDYSDYGKIVREATTSGEAPIISVRDSSEQRAAIRGVDHTRTEINVGAYVVDPKLLFSELGTMANAGEHRLTELVRRVIAHGKSIYSYRIYDHSEVRGINSSEQFDQAADIVLARIFKPVKNTDTKIVFGTGGWRAVIGEGYTLGNVRRLCQAIANQVIRDHKETQGVVIGGDRRFLSRESTEAAAEVFAGNNIPVTLLRGDVPTPLVTFATTYLNNAYGIIITSSHNPPEWNGMKVFRTDGSLPLDNETDQFQDEANALTAADVVTLDLATARAANLVIDADLDEEYIDAIEKLIDVDLVRGSKLRVVVDPMYGTSQFTLGTILSDMRVRTEFIHAAHNPLFGGIAPAPDLERLSALVQIIREGKGRFNLGLATDGDSDRIGVVDEKGNYVDANELLLLLYWYLHEVRHERGGVVRNLATTHLLDRLADHFGEPHMEARVGFKHVTAAMEQIGAVLGGESSGGLTVRGWLLGKDGIFACALVVEMLARTGKSISELLEDIYAITGRMYMAEVSMAATPEMRVAVPRKLTAEALAAAGCEASDSGRLSLRPDIERVSNLDGIKIYFTDGSWALARFSGTEPLLRIVAEAETKAQAQETLDWLETIVLG